MITHYLQTISARKSICGTKFTKRSHMTMLKNDINCPSCLRLIGERRHYRVAGNQYSVCGVLPAEFSDSRHRVTCEQCIEILNKDIVEAVDEIKTGEGQSHPSPDDGPIEPDKFTVIRTDGGSARGKKHHKCRYWVLDLDHDQFIIPALIAYAEACAGLMPVLSGQVLELVAQLQNEQAFIRQERFEHGGATK